MPRRNIADYLPQEYGQSREALPEYSKAQIYSSLSNKGKKELFESEQRIGQAPPTYDGFFGELGEVAADFPAAVARPLVSTAQELGFEWGDKAAKALEEYDSRHMDRRAPAGYSALDFRPGSLVRTVGNAAASTVPAVVLGTAGAAAGSLVSPGVGTAAGWTAGVMASFASTYGDEVKQMRQLLPDRTEEDVRTAALLSSGIQALIEVGMGPEAVLRKMVTNGGKKMVVAQTNAGVLQALKQFAKEHPVGIKGFLTQAVKSGGEEAGEEAMQYLTHLVVSKAFGSDEQFSGREMLENSFAGLVGGFFLGGVGYPLARWKQGGMQNAVTEGEYSFEGDNPDARKLSAMEMASRAMDMGLVTRDEVKENVPGKLGDTLVNAGNLISRLSDAVSAPDVESETQAVEETPQPEARRLDDTEQAVETARLFDEIFGTRTLINNDEVAAKIHEYADEKKATLSQEEQERFDEGRIEGVQEGDTFYLRGKGRDLLRIQGHEFKHWLDKTHPDIASFLDEKIEYLLNENGNAALKREIAHYGKNAETTGRREFFADMIGGVLRDGQWRKSFLKSLDRLSAEKPGIVESFLRAAKEFADKVIGFLRGKEQLSSTEQTLFADYQKLSDIFGGTLGRLAKKRGEANGYKVSTEKASPVTSAAPNAVGTQSVVRPQAQSPAPSAKQSASTGTQSVQGVAPADTQEDTRQHTRVEGEYSEYYSYNGENYNQEGLKKRFPKGKTLVTNEGTKAFKSGDVGLLYGDRFEMRAKGGIIPTSENGKDKRGFAGVKVEPVFYGEEGNKRPISGAIMSYQGGKKDVADRAACTIRTLMKKELRDKVKVIAEAFGGTCQFATAVSNAVFPNARLVVINELSETRVAGAKLVESKGREVAKIVRDCLAKNALWEKLVESLKSSQKNGFIYSNNWSGINKKISELIKEDGNLGEEEVIALHVLQDTYSMQFGSKADVNSHEERWRTYKKQRSDTASYPWDDSDNDNGNKKDSKATFLNVPESLEKMLLDFEEQLVRAKDSLDYFKKRGGKIVYVNGDAANLIPEVHGVLDREKLGDVSPDEVFCFTDPPYVDTKGYGEGGPSVVTVFPYQDNTGFSWWSYTDTTKLNAEMAKEGWNYYYTDEASWLHSDKKWEEYHKMEPGAYEEYKRLLLVNRNLATYSDNNGGVGQKQRQEYAALRIAGEENGRKAEADANLTVAPVGRSEKGTPLDAHGKGEQDHRIPDGGADNGKESGLFNERREDDHRGLHGDSPAVHDMVGGDQGGSGESGVVREASGREGGLLQTDSAGVAASTQEDTQTDSSSQGEPVQSVQSAEPETEPVSDTETGKAPAAVQEQAAPQEETPTVASTPEAEAPAKSASKKARALSPKELEAKGRKGIEEFIDNWLWENRRQLTPESKELAVEILLDEVKKPLSRVKEEDLLNMAARGDEAAENFIYDFLDFIDMSQSRGVDGAYEFDDDSIKNAMEAAIDRNYDKLIDIDFDDNYDPTAKAKGNARNSRKKRSGSYRWHDSPSEQDIRGDEVASEQVNQVVDEGTSRAEYQEDIDNATHTRESRAEFDRLTRRMVARRGGRTPFARDVIEGRAPSDRYVLNAVRMLLNDPDAETVFTPEERKALRKKFIEGATQYGRDLASLRRRRVHALTEGEAMGIQLGIDALVESANDPEALRRKIAEDFGVDISNLSTEDLTTPERLNDILLGLYTQKATVWDKAYEVWINGILSGIKTHVVNTLGNTANLVYEFLPRRAAEALVNSLFAKRPDGATFGELKYLWKNLGWRHAADAFRKVYAMETLGEGGKWSESSSGPAIKGPIGGIIRTPSRFLRAADAFAKALAHPAEASAYAYRIGKSQGLEGKALAEFISQEMENPESKSNIYADQRVLELTFQEDGGLAVRHLTNLRNKTPFGRYFLPFIKTPANLLRQGIRKGPLGLAGLLVDTYQIARGKGSVDNAYIAHAAEQIVAWGTALLLMGLHMDDDEPWITGNETEQYGTGEQQFRSRHIPPMSIRIGNNWFSYARIEPLSTGLAAFADGLAGLREASDGASVTSAVRKMISGTGRIVADKSYLDSVRQLMEIVQDPEKSAMDYASSYIGSWVPNIYRQMRNSMDENVPDYRNREKGNEWFSRWWEVTLSKAGLAERTPKRDYFGRTVPKDAAGSGVGAFLERLVSPFERKPVDMDPMDRMLWEYNRRNPDSQYYPSLPSPVAKVNGRDVSFVDNYDELCRVAGEQAYKELRFLAKTRRINTRKPSDRDIATVKSVLARARKRARELLVRQHKEDRR